MKVICAGLSKTGTKSMASALRTLGYNVHDYFQQYVLDKELWNKIRDNSETIEDYRRIMKDVDAVTDLQACTFWEELHEAFPDAKVILMVRSSEDEWYKSLETQSKRSLELSPLKGYGVPDFVTDILGSPLRRDNLEFSSVFTPGSLGLRNLRDPPISAMARAKYRQHNSYVKATCPESQLLVYNVKDGWEPLCEFLDLPVPATHFPTLNIKGELDQLIANKTIDDLGFSDAVKKQEMTRLCTFGIVVLALLVYLFQNYIF